MDARISWKSVEVPEGASLLRKERFTYQAEHGEYDIELFETPSGEYYAVGTPHLADKIVVFGSPVVADPALALQTVIDKIERERPGS
ncbi:MAG: hypothetical protein QJR06_10660 [Alicyclobacillaceae bacterium]|nr:hypothetical protein [Alicyclobacillaceae bacterium]